MNQSSTREKMEVKEFYDRERFVGLMRAWLYALEHHEPLDVLVEGQKFNIPAAAADQGHCRVEFEREKDGEYEFELTLKWR